MTRPRLPSVFSSLASSSVILLFVVSAVLPFYWMTITSFKSRQELFSLASPLWVEKPTLANYHDLLQFSPFANWFFTSATVSIAATLIALAFGSLAAYGLSRRPSRFGIALIRVVLITYLIPRVVFVVPLYTMLNNIGLLNTRVGLVIAYLTFTLPFTTWLLVGFFETIPKELDEAAMIDGASPLGVLIRVVLPLAAPGLVAASIYSFSTAWNEFLYPLALVQTASKTTLTAGIASMQQGDVFAWGQIMAAGTLTSLPVLIVYAFIYKRIVGGLAVGAVKG